MAAGREVVGRGHMRDAFVMLFALGFGAAFAYMMCYSSARYYTTWALGVHVVYFVAFAVNTIWIGDNVTITRWGFAPGFCVAVSVALAVVYLIASQWDSYFDEYCKESDECYDLMMEFIMTHYTPPFAYLLMYLLDGTIIASGKRTPELHWAYHWCLLTQLSLVPGNVYAAFYNMNIVYGEGTKNPGMALYGFLSIVWSLLWCLVFKD
jgi:hypothetical protein